MIFSVMFSMFVGVFDDFSILFSMFVDVFDNFSVICVGCLWMLMDVHGSWIFLMNLLDDL